MRSSIRTASVVAFVFFTFVVSARAGGEEGKPAVVTPYVHPGKPMPAGTTQPTKPPKRGNLSLTHEYGTRVGLRIARPQRDVLGLVTQRSRLDRVVDDKGNVLNELIEEGEPRHWPHDDRYRHAERKVDREQVEAYFWFPAVPPEDAKRVTVEGTAVLLCGSDLVTGDEIVLEPGSTHRDGETVFVRSGETPVHVGLLKASLRVTPRDDDDDTDVELVTAQRAVYLNVVDDIWFFDGDGRRLPSEWAGTGVESGSKESDLKFSKRWKVKGKPADLRARLRHYAKVEHVEVPFSVGVDLKPFPPGPFEKTVELGEFVPGIRLRYDKYALRDAGLTPAAIEQQLKAFLQSRDSFTLKEIAQFPVKLPEGSVIKEAPLFLLDVEVELTFRKTSPVK